MHEGEIMRSFKKGVAEELGFYVYRLIDPRNGQTFYVGKGRGDRVFAHINDELALGENEDERSMKLETIREIRRARLPPVHVIHRHGMKEEVAIEVEATLIDVFAGGLTNVAVGQDSNRRGPANAAQLDAHYAAEVLEPMAEAAIETDQATAKMPGRPLASADVVEHRQYGMPPDEAIARIAGTNSSRQVEL